MLNGLSCIVQGQYLVVPQDVFRAQFGAERNACADIARDKFQVRAVYNLLCEGRYPVLVVLCSGAAGGPGCRAVH